VHKDWRATGQSLLYASYYGAGAIAGNLWTGFLYGANIKIASIFLLNAVIISVVGIIIWLFTRSKQISRPV
jgi:hypothetical protein